MTTPIARAQGRLGALKTRLEIYNGLDVQLLTHGIRVSNPFKDGCCDDAPEPSDLITCKARSEDGGRLWFVHSWGEWIAEADKVIDASVAIASRLGAR